jgi:hypothetical protein
MYHRTLKYKVVLVHPMEYMSFPVPVAKSV